MNAQIFVSVRLLRLAIGALLAGVAAFGVMAQGTQPKLKYSVVEFAIPPGYGQLKATAMNNKGEIVMWAQASSSPFLDQMYLYLPAPAYGLPAGLNGIASPNRRVYPHDINDHGVIVGSVVTTDTTPQRTRGFVWANGAFTQEFNLEDISDGTTLTAVNNHGAMAGVYLVAKPGVSARQVNRGFVLTTNTSIILNPVDPLTNHTFTVAMNDRNHVAGNFAMTSIVGFYERGFFWDGTLLPLGPRPIADQFRLAVYDFNQQDEIVGVVAEGNGSPSQAFLWLPAPKYGRPAGLNLILSAGNPSSAAMNDLGQVVTPTEFWDAGTVRRLSTMLPANLSQPLAEIVAMNNRAQVVAIPFAVANQLARAPVLLNPGTNEVIVVNVDSDDEDANPDDGVIDVDLAAAGAQVSLRAAIQFANSTNRPGADTIEFDIDSAGPVTIVPRRALPEITGPLTLDGLSQPGTGRIGLSGHLAGMAHGLGIVASNCLVRGFSIQRFQQAGVALLGGHSHTIKGNLIGTDAAGVSGLGNRLGLLIQNSFSNVVGGASAADRNVISANTADGVAITNASTIELRSNFIGTNPEGSTGLANGLAGLAADRVNDLQIGTESLPTVLHSPQAATLHHVNLGRMINCLIGVNASGNTSLGGIVQGFLIDGCREITVGGTARNVLGGISSTAIQILNSTNIQLAANYIGTDRNGSVHLPVGTGVMAERSVGVSVGSAALTLICATNGAVFRGIAGFGTNLARIVNTHFGVNAGGSAKLGDMTHGLLAELTSDLQVGSDTRNVFGGIAANAITLIETTNTRLAGNYIGTDRNGNLSLPVGAGVVARRARDLVIGATNALTLICATNGVQVSDVSGASNSVNNCHFGLGANGVTRIGTMLNGLIGERSAGLTLGDIARNVFGGIGSNAITLLAITNAHVAANFIGTDRTGSTSVPVGTGLFVENAHNLVIGATNALSVFAATNGAILRNLGGLTNLINHCYFGVSASGSNRLGNMRTGLSADQSSNLGLGTVARNVFGFIASNAIVFRAATNIQLAANSVGTDLSRVTRAAIGGNGITATATRGLTLGSETAPGALIVGGSSRHGIEVVDSPQVRVVNADIGANAVGTRTLSNTLSGIRIHVSTNTAASADPFTAASFVSGNTIAFNGSAGLEFSQDPTPVAHELAHVVQQNNIRQNAGDGVRVGTNVAAVRIGGTNLAGANVIQQNGGSGVCLTSPGDAVFVEINTISSNSVKAVERAFDPLSPGAPQVSSAIKGSTQVQGTVSGPPNQTLRLQFYGHPPKSGSQGEGQLWLGTVHVPLNSAGAGTYNSVLARTTPTGWFVASTAADPVRGTSEFSTSRLVALSPDSDGDGMPDAWETRYPSCLNPAVRDGTGDCDGDGFSNLQEYIAHTDPTRADSALRVENLLAASGGGPATLQFQGVAGRQYGLERRLDLTTGAWVRVVTAMPEADGQVTLRDLNPPAANAYYRIVAELP